MIEIVWFIKKGEYTKRVELYNKSMSLYMKGA